MITHFIPGPQVEGFPSISILRDHEDPFTFYYMTTTPRISVDKETNLPVFDYMVIARDLKRQGSEGVQEGRLVLSVNLALTDKEMDAVESSVNKFINGTTFSSQLKEEYKNYDINKGTNVQIVVLRNNRIRKYRMSYANRDRLVTIKAVDFTEGTAAINLATSDFDGKFTHETKPALFGDCNATLAVNLDTQESQILYQIFKPSDKDDKSVNLSAVVAYNMKYRTVLPFVATAKINYKRIYDEFQDLKRSHQGMDTKYRGVYNLPSNIQSAIPGGAMYCNGSELYASKEGIDNYLRNSDTTTQNITVTIKDYSGDANNAQYEQIILTAMQNQLTEKVCEKLFEKCQPLSPEDVEVTQNDVKLPENNDGGKKRKTYFDVCYRLSNDAITEASNDYDITIRKDKVVEVEANPNGSLVMMGEEGTLASLVRELDASNIYFQEMLVPIKVDNTNFGRDIAMISVRVIYKDKSGAVKLDKVFHFDEEDPQPKTFRVIMSRDDKGQLIDKFYYRTRIRYRGFDVFDKSVKEEAKWTEQKEAAGVGEGIYVPYSDMRNLCVNCEAGDVAWDVIQKLAIEFKYKDAPDKNGATKLMTLTEDSPSDSWNCYMYNDTDNFLYRIHYFYKDGTDDWSQQFEGRPTTKNLVIDDKLSGIHTVKFDINFKKSVERVRVLVRCQGREEESSWINQPDTWCWSTRMKEDGDMTFQYKYQYYLVNGDESMQTTDWSAPISTKTESNRQTIEIDLKVNQISLIIDGESIDWKKWSRVYLHFKYDDPANNLHYDDESIQPLKLSPSKTEATIVIPVVNEAIRPRIVAEYIPAEGADVIPSEEATANKIVILPNAAPPKSEPTLPAADPAPAATTQAPQPQGSTTTPESATESAPEPAKKLEPQDLTLTFTDKGIDWDKWFSLYIHVKYDDDANSIHINDQILPPFKMKSGGGDKTVTFQIMDPEIKPKVSIDYLPADSGDPVTTDYIRVEGPIISLPNDVPCC